MSGPKCSQYAFESERRAAERYKIRQELKKKKLKELHRLEKTNKVEKNNQVEEVTQIEDTIQFEEEIQIDELQIEVIETPEFEEEVDELLEIREQEVIAETIDEVMMEMGYELLGTVTPKIKADNQVIKNEMFSYSDGVGLQVTEVAGQVSLEVVGIGTTDRMPTNEERAYLKENMETFCDAYKEIEKKLADKGIVRSEVKYMYKPDERFAKIQNVSGYDDEIKAETLQQVMSKKDRKETGNAADKVLSLHNVQQKGNSNV